jgi:hypothetical protein
MRPQNGSVVDCQTEYEITRESRAVALHLLVEALGGYAVQRGEITVENDPVAA